jgi:serine/threonine-protein kinase RsbW
MAVLERTFTLSVPSSVENLAMVRDFIRNVGEHAGFEESDLIKLVMAVDEACTNIVEHAYGHDVTKEVTIKAIYDDKELNIKLIDTGRQFNPIEAKSESLKDLVRKRKSGGLGIRLINTLVDEVRYEFLDENKNLLHLIKKLPSKNDSNINK